MVTISGYFDGREIHPLEKFSAMKNQRVIITFMDDFVETGTVASAKNGTDSILSKVIEETAQMNVFSADASGKDVSRRMGVAKGRFNIPDDFDKWDEEIIQTIEEDTL